MNKKNFLIVGFLIVFFSTAYVQYRNIIPQRKVISPQVVNIKQVITIDGEINKNTLKVKQGLTALQLLKSTHKVISRGEKENAFIGTIDGRVASDAEKEFWSFYVNGKQAQVGAGSYVVKNNDTIEWKIETY